MNENIITWNVTNWVTIVLMAALGFMIMATITAYVRNRRGSGAATEAGE